MAETGGWNLWDARVRDTLLFALGIAGATNELFIQMTPRYAAFPLIAGLLAAPPTIRFDERRRAKKRDTSDGD